MYIYIFTHHSSDTGSQQRRIVPGRSAVAEENVRKRLQKRRSAESRADRIAVTPGEGEAGGAQRVAT